MRSPEASEATTRVEDLPRPTVDRLIGRIQQVIRGKREVVDLVVTALLARGHVLIEDVPGVGKTTLARALALSVGGTFHRIQFTSDLMPSDIIGVSVWNAERREFEFRPGPLFANLVLADEINRTTPKTQSALLEAMSDETVTVDDREHALPDPFFVIGTQNPVDHSGTFPLPDSQLDRFLVRTRMGYPSEEIEAEILNAGGRDTLRGIEPVVTLDELRALRGAVDEVAIHADLVAYLVSIVSRTRSWDAVSIGASPRASLDLQRAARARALVKGRDHVVPDDIKRLVVPVLAHRLVFRDRADVLRAEALLEALVETVNVPT